MYLQYMSRTFPLVPKDLLEELERLWPDRCPNLDVSERELWAHVGAVRLIRFLRQKHDEQIRPKG